MPRRGRATFHGLVLAAALVACAVAASACGGGPATPGVASVAATTSGGGPSSQGENTTGATGQTFSACMRSHGVPKFPDASAGGGIAIDAKSGIDPSSPQFQAAQKACQKLAPNGGKAPSPAEAAKAQAQALKFSACMRSHGLPDFPDPTFSGGMTQIRIGSKGGGLDPGSPIFQAAQKACEKLMPGRPGGHLTQSSGGPAQAGAGPASAGGTATGAPGK
jgi:hypothetical protein